MEHVVFDPQTPFDHAGMAIAQLSGQSWEDRDVGGSVLVSAFFPGVGTSDIVGLSGGVGAAPLRCLCSIPGACMHVHFNTPSFLKVSSPINKVSIQVDQV